MSATVKSVISLVVLIGIAYVLISPLPEMDATFSGKTAFSLFVLVPLTFLTLFFFAFLTCFYLSDLAATLHLNVLDLLCVRLC